MIEKMETPEEAKMSVLAHNMHLQFWEIIKTNLSSNDGMDNYNQMGCCVIAIMNVLDGLTKVIKNGTEKDFKFKDMLETIDGMHKQFEMDNKE